MSAPHGREIKYRNNIKKKVNEKNIMIPRLTSDPASEFFG
jgi:hypothetical protein